MTDMFTPELLVEISHWILPILLAITLHEAAHGFVAWRLGDDTAYRLGRVTANPVRHVDLFGTIILPAILLLGSKGHFTFGFAKPVPVRFDRLNNPRRDMILVAAAGPGTNFLIAAVAALLVPWAMALGGGTGSWITNNLYNAVWINVLLAVFNLLPLPPLDGGRVAVGLLPMSLAEPLARLERYGFIILIGALFILPFVGRQLGFSIDIFSWLVVRPALFISGLFLTLAGL